MKRGRDMQRFRRGVFLALVLAAVTAALTVSPATAAPISTAKACWAGAPTIFDVDWMKWSTPSSTQMRVLASRRSAV